MAGGHWEGGGVLTFFLTSYILVYRIIIEKVSTPLGR